MKLLILCLLLVACGDDQHETRTEKTSSQKICKDAIIAQGQVFGGGVDAVTCICVRQLATCRAYHPTTKRQIPDLHASCIDGVLNMYPPVKESDWQSVCYARKDWERYVLGD